jgi:hypothetical protein
MKPSEIIKRVAMQVGIDPNVAIIQSHKRLQQPGEIMIQHDDSLMYYKNIGNMSACVYFLSLDPALKMVSSFHYFIKKLKQVGIQMIYMNTQNKQVIEALKTTGITMVPSNVPQYQLMAKL